MNCIGRVLLGSNANPLWSMLGKTTNSDEFHHIRTLHVAYNEGIKKTTEFEVVPCIGALMADSNTMGFFGLFGIFDLRCSNFPSISDRKVYEAKLCKFAHWCSVGPFISQRQVHFPW